MTQRSRFRYYKTSPEIIPLTVMMHIRFPLSLRNVEDLPHERGIDICHVTARFWWHRFGPMFRRDTTEARLEYLSHVKSMLYGPEKVRRQSCSLHRVAASDAQGRSPLSSQLTTFRPLRLRCARASRSAGQRQPACDI